MKKKTVNRSLLKSLLLLGIILISVVFTLAWFGDNQEIAVNGLEASTDYNVKLSISEDGETWNDNLVINTNDFVGKPVVGDGSHFFCIKDDYTEYVSETIEVNEQDYDIKARKRIDELIYDNVTGNSHLYDYYVYKKEFFIKTDNASSLFLDSTSSILPGDNSLLSAMYYLSDGERVYYSTGNIVGAGRFVLYVNDNNVTLNADGTVNSNSVKNPNWRPVIYWIPNSTIELKKNETPEKITYSLNLDGEVEEKYLFVNNIVKKEDEDNPYLYEITYDCQIETEDKESGLYKRKIIENPKKREDYVYYMWGDLEDIDDLFVNDFDGNTVKQYKILFWIDGFDRECDNVLSGGTVDLNINFNGMEKIESE